MRTVVNTCTYNMHTLFSNDPYFHENYVYPKAELCVLSARTSTAGLCCMWIHCGRDTGWHKLLYEGSWTVLNIIDFIYFISRKWSLLHINSRLLWFLYFIPPLKLDVSAESELECMGEVCDAVPQYSIALCLNIRRGSWIRYYNMTLV